MFKNLLLNLKFRWVLTGLGLITAPLFFYVMGYAVNNTHFNSNRLHHQPEGFRNNYPHGAHENFLKWRWERWNSPPPATTTQGWRTPRVKTDAAYLRRNSGKAEGDTTVTWIGHATLLVQLKGLTVLTDPHFSERASPIPFFGPRRVSAPALGLEALPPIDAVVISHNHYDHLDLASVQALSRRGGGNTRFFVPLGLKDWFLRQGITEVQELDWWERATYRGLEFHLVPAQHFSARAFKDRNLTLWGGWVIHSEDFRFYFAGDTGYSEDFREIGRRLGPFDLAAIPIGAYEPRWFMRSMHVNPAEAVRIHADVNTRQSLAMHWGTFRLTDEPLDEPPVRLGEALDAAGIPRESFWVDEIGRTRVF